MTALTVTDATAGLLRAVPARAVAGPRVARPGVARPGVPGPAVAGPRVAAPGIAAPGIAGPDVAVPGAAAPGGAGRFKQRHRGCVERVAEDVDLALEHDAVASQVVVAARDFQRTGAGALREPLRRAVQPLVEEARQVEAPLALRLVVSPRDPLGVGREELLDLIRAGGWPLLEQQRRGARDERRRLRRAAAALVAGVDQAGRRRQVDERTQDAEALEVRPWRDEVGV